jgi:hypothetical protein
VPIEVALARARFGFGAARNIEGRLCRFERSASGVDLVARDLEFAVDLHEPATLREAPGGASRSMRCRDKPVPAPQIALA